MRLVLVNIYPVDTVARYLLSSYVLKSYLMKSVENKIDLDIQVLDFSNLESASRISKKIKAYNPNFVGYSCYVWNIELVFNVIHQLRGTKEVIHILGGPEISYEHVNQLYEKDIADYYIIGEGEIKLTSLIKYLFLSAKGIPEELPKGIVKWDKIKKTLLYSQSDEVVQLGEIPSVYLNGIIDEKILEGGQIFLETQRGCKFRCKYCVYHKNLHAISYYPLDNMLKEIEFLITEKHVAALRFIDAIFTSDLNRAKKIVKHLLKFKNDNINIPWIYWEFGYTEVDDEFFEMISRLKDKASINNYNEVEALDIPQFYTQLLEGYRAINCVGLQSTNGKALQAVGRAKINNDKLNDFMLNFKQYNLVLKLDVILGLPFETFDSYFGGIELIIPYFEDTDSVFNIHLLQILPNSELEKVCKELNVIYSSVAPHYVLCTNTMTKEEISHASKLTALLFRIINSPLRAMFYNFKKFTDKSCRFIMDDIYNNLTTSMKFKNSKLVTCQIIDDIYWNREIFYDIPTVWLKGYLKVSEY